MLAQILLIVGRILVAVGSANTVLAFIQNIVTNLQLNPTRGTLDQRLNRQDTALFDLGAGETTIITREDIIIANQASSLTTLLAAIAAAQQATDPVILPTTPPTGYGGGSGSFDLADIWEYQYPPGSGNIMGDKLVKAGRGAEFTAQDDWYPHAYAKYLGHHYDTTNYYYQPSTYPLPVPDVSTILPTDASILDWANRTITGFTWVLLNNQVVSYSHTNYSDEWWVITLSDMEFGYYKNAGAAVALNIAPVWPGIDNVTLGDPIDLLSVAYLNVPMHGCLIRLLSVDPHKSFYQFNYDRSWRNVGAVAFYSEHGDVEHAQTIATDYGIYVPRTFAIAAGCEWRTSGVLSATLTPWVITAP